MEGTTELKASVDTGVLTVVVPREIAVQTYAEAA
jgi:hypothetical protein